VGYSLAFGPDWHGVIGNLDWVGLKGVGQEPGGPNGAIYGLGIPHLLFMAFQMMFAIITPALITGAFAERAKFGPFLIFIAAWVLLVYVPVAHWVFAYDGWLSAFSANADTPDIGLNSLDFAGGMAIHVNAGVAALAAVLVFGKRKGYGSEPMEPHDITMVTPRRDPVGWFGFNAGSARGDRPGRLRLHDAAARLRASLDARVVAVRWRPSVVGAPPAPWPGSSP
jgi:Amt family ammonium transporter